jgi:hypothetical protein
VTAVTNSSNRLQTKEEKEEEDEDGEEKAEETFGLPPAILASAFQQASMECDNMNLTELSAELSERLFEINPNYAAQVGPML